MTNRSGSLERAVVKSSVMPSLKYSCCGSSLMLAKGNTAMEGLSGNGRAGTCAGGMDAEGVGGRKERCWTSTTVPTMITSPASEKTPPRQCFRRDRLGRCASGCSALQHYPQHPHRLGDVLNRLRAEVVVIQHELVFDLRVNGI